MSIQYQLRPGYKLVPFCREFLKKSGWTKYQKWQQDPEVTKFNSHGLFYTDRDSAMNWALDCEIRNDNCTYAIMKRDEWIGMCSLQRIDFVNRSAEIAIYIGEKKYWGQGLASEAITALCRHGFLALGLHRIWSGTAQTNLGMNKVFIKLGFDCEGHFREGMFLSGEYVDVNCYSILEREFAK